MANFAQLKVDQGDLSAAETLLHDAVAIIGRSFGEKHGRTARMLGHLGGVVRKQQRLDEAAAMLDEALALARSALGPDRPHVAALMIERAQVHVDRAEFAVAEPRVFLTA